MEDERGGESSVTDWQVVVVLNGTGGALWETI